MTNHDNNWKTDTREGADYTATSLDGPAGAISTVGFTHADGTTHATMYVHGVTDIEVGSEGEHDGRPFIALRFRGEALNTMVHLLGGSLDALAAAVQEAITRREEAATITEVIVDGVGRRLRMAPDNISARAVLIVNDVAVAFGTERRAAEAAIAIDHPYEPVFGWDPHASAFNYAGTAQDILDELV